MYLVEVQVLHFTAERLTFLTETEHIDGVCAEVVVVGGHTEALPGDGH